MDGPLDPAPRRMHAATTAVCIMAKAPAPGASKTRLCPPLTPPQAAALSAAFALDTLQAARGLDDAAILLSYTGDRALFPAPLRELEAFVQRGADLGARIEHAARMGLARAERVLVIGSDLPGLPAAHLVEARAALDHHGAVLGPSSDGGFYLIGLHACPPGLLAGLPWSVPETRAACAARLVQRGLHVAKIAGFDDVDTIDDLRRLRYRVAQGELHAPATAKRLALLLETLPCD